MKSPLPRFGFRLFTACVLLIISSCTPQQKMNRLLRKYPELQKTVIDSIRVTWRDSVIIQREEHSTRDTLVRFDTVTVFNTERTLLKYVYNPINDSLVHLLEEKPDTIRITKTEYVPFEQQVIKYEDREVTPWWVWLIVAAALIFSLLIVRFVK